MKKIREIVALSMILAMICVGCGNSQAPAFQGSSAAGQEAEEITQEQIKDEVDKSVYMDPAQSVEERVSALLSQMTLGEKVAQMIQPEQAAVSTKDIKKYGFGSVLSGGGSAPKSGNEATDWQKHINGMKQAALETRLGIPLLYGVDAVHGHGNVYGATVFPHNIGLGAANDEELMVEIGRIVAKETRATGIQWIFAPTLANPQNELWGRTYEGFSENEKLVANLGAAFTKGAQGDFSEASVVTTAKHYLGEGYTVAGTNQGDVQMPEDEFETLLREVLLTPYKANVEAGVRTVMASFNSVNGLKCHENKYLLTDVLKGDLGFMGFVIGDYNGAQQVSGANYKEQLANCVNAGVDMLMEPYSWKEVHKLLQQAVKEGLITEERIDDAVSRILRVKFEAGLFEETVAGETEQSLLKDFGSEEHRLVAREAVRKSMVLLKNDVVLQEPDGNKTAMQILEDSKKLLVVGAKANDIGVQCGGWTITWQGTAGNITAGTTILEALQNVDADREIIFNTDGEVKGDEDAILVVVGENPYAETSGDRSSSTLTISGEDKALLKDMEEAIEKAREKNVPVIMLLLSGRPVTIADYIDCFDAIIAAWLPGSEGDGVADVLLGDYDFTGRLPYTWPWYASDIETKFEEGKEGNILFEFGTGLTKNG